MYSQERVAPIRSGSSTRFSSDSLPLFVAARISQKLLPVVGRELQVAGCGLGLSSVCGVFTFDASCKCAIFSLSLFILFLFSRTILHATFSMLHTPFSILLETSRQSGNQASRQFISFFCTDPRPQSATEGVRQRQRQWQRLRWGDRVRKAALRFCSWRL